MSEEQTKGNSEAAQPVGSNALFGPFGGPLNQPFRMVTKQPLLFREQRGSLEDSMRTVREMPTRGHLEAYIHERYGEGVVTVEPYRFDSRIGWDTQIVCLNGQGCGFMSGPFETNISDEPQKKNE